jgi:uncharacterized protein YprB with RNaseH-like and TPR domain
MLEVWKSEGRARRLLVIRRTFQHVPGVGPWREKDLWARGIAHWEDFPAAGGGVGLSTKLDGKARARLAEAEAALEARDLGALGRLFPAREHWRLFREFADEAVYFDIETDDTPARRPTVVALYDADGVQAFVQGRNLEALPAALAKRGLWVTFNGSCFDVPVLRDHFPELPEPDLHLDLRFHFQRLGMGSGLKALEDRMGIGRPPHLRGVNGWDAVLMWREYEERRSPGVLRRLVEYNLYDAFQLRSLMEKGYNLAIEALGLDEPPMPVFDRGNILYDVSRALEALEDPTGRPRPSVLAAI